MCGAAWQQEPLPFVFRLATGRRTGDDSWRTGTNSSGWDDALQGRPCLEAGRSHPVPPSETGAGRKQGEEDSPLPLVSVRVCKGDYGPKEAVRDGVRA